MCDWFTNFPVFSTGRSYLQKMTLYYQHTHMVCATSYILGRLMVYSSLGPRSDIRAGWGLGTRLGLQQQFIEIAQSLLTVKRVVAHNIGGWLLSKNSFVSFSAHYNAHCSQGRPGYEADQTSMWSDESLEWKWLCYHKVSSSFFGGFVECSYKLGWPANRTTVSPSELNVSKDFLGVVVECMQNWGGNL